MGLLRDLGRQERWERIAEAAAWAAAIILLAGTWALVRMLGRLACGGAMMRTGKGGLVGPRVRRGGVGFRGGGRSNLRMLPMAMREGNEKLDEKNRKDEKAPGAAPPAFERPSRGEQAQPSRGAFSAYTHSKPRDANGLSGTFP